MTDEPAVTDKVPVLTPPPPPPPPTCAPPPPPPATTKYSTLETPWGTVQLMVPVEVNVRTMYFDEPLVPSATSTPLLVALDNMVVAEAPTVTESELEAVFELPAASVNEPELTDTLPVPAVAPVTVKVAVRLVPEVVRFESEPRERVKSPTTRSVTSSLNVIVIVQLAPEA